MRIECPDCNALYDDSMMISGGIENSILSKFFGINKARRLMNRANFLLIDDENMLCPECNCIFNRHTKTVKVREGRGMM